MHLFSGCEGMKQHKVDQIAMLSAKDREVLQLPPQLLDDDDGGGGGGGGEFKHPKHDSTAHTFCCILYEWVAPKLYLVLIFFLNNVHETNYRTTKRNVGGVLK